MSACTHRRGPESRHIIKVQYLPPEVSPPQSLHKNRQAHLVTSLNYHQIPISLLIQLNRVKQPVRLCESRRVVCDKRLAVLGGFLARRLAVPPVLVDLDAAEVRVDDDGVLLEVLSDAALVARLRRLKVHKGLRPRRRVGAARRDVRGNLGPREEPDLEGGGLVEGRVDAAAAGVEAVAA